MKKFFVLICIATLFISGCIEQKIQTEQNITVKGTVKNGSTVSVDYVASFEDGKVFDTSIASIAKQNNIYVQTRKYQPMNFTVGAGRVIKGFDEGVIGMKVGETKTLIIPPENGYGLIDPIKIEVIPIIDSIPASATLPKNIEIPADQFHSDFGNHTIGDIVNVPDTNINMTINNIGKNVSLTYDLKVGEKIYQKGQPWNQTVVSIDNNNVTIRPDIKLNDTVNLPNTKWNTTIIGLNNTDITLRHNPIPDKHISSTFGNLNIHFNETSIIIDQNSQFAGKTLIFNVTLRSIS